MLLGRKVPAGSDLTLRIQCDAKRPIDNYNWSFSYLARGGWLPLVRFGDMIPDFDLTVKVRAPVEFPTVIFGIYEQAESSRARGIGLPEYRVEWKQRATEDGKWLIEGTIRQRTVVGLKKHAVDGVFFRGKVPLTVTFPGGREAAVPIVVEGEVTPFKFKMPEECSRSSSTGTARCSRSTCSRVRL